MQAAATLVAVPDRRLDGAVAGLALLTGSLAIVLDTPAAVRPLAPLRLEEHPEVRGPSVPARPCARSRRRAAPPSTVTGARPSCEDVRKPDAAPQTLVSPVDPALTGAHGWLVVATVAVGVLLVVEAIALVRARAWVERVYVPLGMVAAVLAGVRCGLWLVTGVPPSTWLAEVAATLPALLLCGTSLLRAHHLAERDAIAALHAD